MDDTDRYLVRKMYYHGATVREIAEDIDVSKWTIIDYVRKETSAGRLCRVWEELAQKRNMQRMNLTDIKTGAYESQSDHYLRRYNQEDVVVLRVSEYLRLIQKADGVKLDIPQLTTPA